MDFYNAYGQGFVRVAACTHHTTLGDPAANAASVLGLARQCHDDGVALAVFPELTLSGYSIEDILLQDALLDAVQDVLLDVVTASANLLPVLVIGAPLRYQHRIYNTAVVIHRGAVLGVVPKSYLPTYREFYERRQVAAGDDERGTIRVCGADVPFGPTYSSPPPTCPASCCTSRSVRTCSSPYRPVLRQRWRARRYLPTCPGARSPSGAPRTVRCWPARRRHGVWPPMSMPRRGRASRRRTWPGTARP
ncbi:carbon-nitrogen hydrolase family protein [Mycobacterium ulcerans str. Harvey]|uniref:Carbon-nitrogen hydrolase family protein n=1 Tax=Mycobacterium ulcerans str. Harvey TaxID=1299332 RepID=A0ABN0QS36_MYCUL|nr:carbon-nitrogen hydrolase family protein [Mycobacterium ulcerans str. Harvey]